MDMHIFVAFIAALLNMAFSMTIPTLIKKTDQPFLTEVKKVFDVNRQVIITSSLIVGITVYLALKVANELKPELSNLAELNSQSSMLPDYEFTSDSDLNISGYPEFQTREVPIIISTNQVSPQLKNLIKLMQH